MKNKLLFLAISLVMIISCEKDNNVKDDIMFVDLAPDLVLHPVDSFSLHPSGLCQEVIPFPTDSTVIVDLDINRDGENDYRFTYSTFYEWVSASSPCANYNSTLQVNGLTAENKIAVVNEDMHEISVLQNGDEIKAGLLFADNAIIYRDNAMGFLYFGDFSGEGYIGVRLHSGEFGWIKLSFERNTFTCVVMEYAYNKTINSNITAGQIE